MRVGIFLTFFASSLAFCSEGYSKPTPQITGTFSDLHFVKEAGDFVGTEIKIVETSQGYQAVVQFAIGVPSDLYLAAVTVSGTAVRISLRNSEGKSLETIIGQISARRFVGVAEDPDGSKEPLNLPRRSSFWDSPNKSCR
jgi:hypothetical protein